MRRELLREPSLRPLVLREGCIVLSPHPVRAWMVSLWEGLSPGRGTGLAQGLDSAPGGCRHPGVAVGLDSPQGPLFRLSYPQTAWGWREATTGCPYASRPGSRSPSPVRAFSLSSSPPSPPPSLCPEQGPHTPRALVHRHSPCFPPGTCLSPSPWDGPLHLPHCGQMVDVPKGRGSPENQAPRFSSSEVLGSRPVPLLSKCLHFGVH